MAKFKSTPGKDDMWMPGKLAEGEIKYGYSNNGEFSLTDDARNQWDSTSFNKTQEEDESVVVRDHNSRKR
jgi:hypothetical protein